jgi:hypothetical protein
MLTRRVVVSIAILPLAFFAACSSDSSDGAGGGECVNVTQVGDLQMPLATVSSGDTLMNGNSVYYLASKSGALWATSIDPSGGDASGLTLPLNDAARSASDIGVDVPVDAPLYGDASAGSDSAQKALACAAKL